MSYTSSWGPSLSLILAAVVTTSCGGTMSATPPQETTADAASSDAEREDVAHADVLPDVARDAQGDDADGANDGEAPSSCPPPPFCAVPLPDFGAARGFRHTSSKLAAKLGSPRHRGRDLFLLEGQPQWVLGKFAYGTTDKDIKDEDVDVYLLRQCKPPWEKVGTFRTTRDGDHDPVLGVEDTGGRIFVDLSKAGVAPLGVGMHRVLMVVAGDRTYTSQYIDVLPKDAKIVVTDVDGTLTSSEYAAVTDLVGLDPPQPHPGAAAVMNAFAARGYHIFYRTARPEWMTHYTRAWLPDYGFPQGILHTTLSGLGAVGSAAERYKQGELKDLVDRTSIVPSYAFGNKDSDVAAYSSAHITPSHCYYFDLDSDLRGGNRLDDYTSLVSFAQSAPLACH